MAEENQAQQGPTGPTVPAEPKEPQQVTTKDPKKVEAGKRLAAINRKKREVKKREEQVQLERTASRVNQYYGFGAILALGVIGGLCYYIYQPKKGGWGEEQPSSNPQQNDPLKTNKFDMD